MSSSFTIPDEERPDARPAKTSPVYDKLKRMGAVFGQRYGWERANWFAPPGVEPKDRLELPAHATTSSMWATRRCACAQHVGVIDLTPFTKHEVTGPGAEAWLDWLVANKVPTKIGRMALCHALTRRGGIRSEFTITKIADQHFYVVSAGAAERYDSDYLLQTLPADGGVGCCAISPCRRGCFVVAGPRSREVLAKLTDAPLDNASFPWLTGQVVEVGLATDVYLLRVNFVGALGWELHFPIEYAHHLFDALFAAGAEFDIGMAGMRAMESLRIEKSYRMWGSDLTPDYTPYEAGLDRFVRMNKGAFIGKERLEKQLAERRAASIRHVRSARRHGRRSARQRAAVRCQRQYHRPRDRRLLRTRLEQELGTGLRQARACARSAARFRSRSWVNGSACDGAGRFAL